MAFMGEHAGRLDGQGRLALPAAFREKLAEGCVLARGLERFLLLYPQEGWQDLLRRLDRAPLTRPEARRFARHLLGGAREATPDEGGRVPVHQDQVSYAGLTGDVVFVGVGSHIEIWDRAEWQRVLPGILEGAASDAEALTPFLT